MLDRRIAGGWRPRTTATVDGEVVLGHAACLAVAAVRPVVTDSGR